MSLVLEEDGAKCEDVLNAMVEEEERVTVLLHHLLLLLL